MKTSTKLALVDAAEVVLSRAGESVIKGAFLVLMLLLWRC